MSGPDPAVAAVRAAVRRALADLDPGAPVLVAFSGGPDSLALLAATAFERAGHCSAVVVDHGWHADSAAVADAARAVAVSLGADPAEVVAVGPLPAGEGPARQARYRALESRARAGGAATVLLGHTLDDQAETVLLGLARGSGARSLSAMRPVRGVFRRPLLGLRRDVTLAACRALGLDAWQDPSNSDARYTRARVRHEVLPALERGLGAGVVEALGRSAELLRDDADLLDALAAEALGRLEPAALDCGALLALSPALRRRVLRLATPARTATQLRAVERLVTDWRGQGPVSLPGGVRAQRLRGRIRLVPPPDVTVPAAPTGVPAPPATAGSPGDPPQADPPDRPLSADIARVLISERRIAERIRELAAEMDADYAGREVLLVGVLKGAIMFMADLSRAMRTETSLEFMAVSSYGAATTTSGVVRILKDLDRDISGRHVIVVEDVIDSGLTLSWLLRNLRSRGPASLEVCTLLRKPEAIALGLPVRYVGFEIGTEFVVGYGLDVAERYRSLPYIGLLSPTSPALSGPLSGPPPGPPR